MTELEKVQETLIKQQEDLIKILKARIEFLKNPRMYVIKDPTNGQTRRN